MTETTDPAPTTAVTADAAVAQMVLLLDPIDPPPTAPCKTNCPPGGIGNPDVVATDADPVATNIVNAVAFDAAVDWFVITRSREYEVVETV